MILQVSCIRNLISKIIIGHIILSVFQSCNKHSAKNDAAIIKKNDSITLWLNEADTKKRSPILREKLLKKAYRKALNSSNDSVKAIYFSKLSLGFLAVKDSARFRDTNKYVLNYAIKTNDTLSLAEAHWDLATFFRRNTIKDSAYYQYFKAEELFSQLGDDFNSGKMLYNMALELADVKDYTKSQITTVEAIKLLKPLDKYKQLYKCYNNLGIISKDLKEYDKAIESYNEALVYFEKSNVNKNLRLNIENNIGVVYQEKGQHHKAIEVFNEIISSDSLYYKNIRLFTKTLNSLAYNRFRANDTLGVEKQLKMALTLSDSIEDIIESSRGHYRLAEYYAGKQDTTRAVFHAEQSKMASLKGTNNDRLLKTLELLISLDLAYAYKHAQEYIKLNDSLQQEERKIKGKFALIRFETDEISAKNQALARQKELLTGIAIGLFLLALASIVIFLQRVKNQKLKFQQQQQESNQEIFDLMLSQKKKVEEGKQSEQKRISEELHDSVVGQMHSVRMLLLGLNKKADETAITLRQDAIEKLKEVQEEVRTISHELNDAAYQKIYNFISSIEDLLKGFQNTEGILAGFEYDDDTDWDQLSGEVKINLYRVIQESLQNCAKHANAKNVSLSLNTNNEGIIATLVDDGVGFDVRKGKKGIGLKNIQSRIQKINGTWGVTSQSGKGTTVQIQVPSIDIRKVEEINLESEQQEA